MASTTDAGEQHFCGRCNVPTEKLCGGRQARHYCSRDCQRTDWSAHKPNCKRVGEKASTEAPASNPKPTWSSERASEPTAAEIEQRARELLSLFTVVHLDEKPDSPAQKSASQRSVGTPPAEPHAAQSAHAAAASTSAGPGPAAEGPAGVAAEEYLQAVRIVAGQFGSQGEPRNVRLRRNGPTFQRGEPSPVLNVLGIPVRVAREADHSHLPRTKRLDNQITTYLMVELDSGLAPDRWQSNIGDSFVYRTDGVPLTADHVWCLWEYFNALLDEYGYPDAGSAGIRAAADNPPRLRPARCLPPPRPLPHGAGHQASRAGAGAATRRAPDPGSGPAAGPESAGTPT
eukprot:tig00020629_g12454.t1